MFFRREKTHVSSFSELLDTLRKQGFQAAPETGGGTRVSKGGCAAVIHEMKGGAPKVDKAGVLIGNEIGLLVDAGYQKYWLTPSGHRAAATADHLRALHPFEEELRDALGVTSLYNQSLGTTNELHLYDRVKDRDHGVAKRPWE
jgi:hypothetical protein